MNSSLEKYIFPVKSETDKKAFFTEKYTEEGHIPEMKGYGLALITSNGEAGEAVRKSLQQFHNQFRNIQIIDLGQIFNTDADTLHTICQELNELRMLPVLIGPELQSITQLSDRVSWNLYHVANRLEAFPESTDSTRCHIGYQRHFSTLEEIYNIEEHSYNSVSLGKMRTYPTLLEPILRDAQMLHIDLNCLRKSDAPNVGSALPTGLNAEDLCQLAKYAGLGDRLECLSVGVADPITEGSPEASIIAETLWYFAEGLNMNLSFQRKTWSWIMNLSGITSHRNGGFASGTQTAKPILPVPRTNTRAQSTTNCQIVWPDLWRACSMLTAESSPRLCPWNL